MVLLKLGSMYGCTVSFVAWQADRWATSRDGLQLRQTPLMQSRRLWSAADLSPQQTLNVGTAWVTDAAWLPAADKLALAAAGGAASALPCPNRRADPATGKAMRALGKRCTAGNPTCLYMPRT